LIGGSSIIGAPQDSEAILVNAFPLDQLIDRKVDVVKIDIEGTEPHAILGMARIIKECRICVVEVGNYHPIDFLKFIFDTFEVRVIDLLCKERPYSLSEVLAEPNCVMAVLRNPIQRTLISSMKRTIKNKASEKRNLLLNALSKKIAKVISRLNP
jgi:hypothetical protein